MSEKPEPPGKPKSIFGELESSTKRPGPARQFSNYDLPDFRAENPEDKNTIQFSGPRVLSEDAYCTISEYIMCNGTNHWTLQTTVNKVDNKMTDKDDKKESKIRCNCYRSTV